MKTEFRELTAAEKAQIWAEVDSEGLGYWIQNYGEAFKGTKYEKLVAQAARDLKSLEILINGFEEFAGDN